MGERDKTNREERRRNEHLTHSHDPLPGLLESGASDERNGAHKKGAKRRRGRDTIEGRKLYKEFPPPPASFPLIRNGGISFFFLFPSLAPEHSAAIINALIEALGEGGGREEESFSSSSFFVSPGSPFSLILPPPTSSRGEDSFSFPFPPLPPLN